MACGARTGLLEGFTDPEPTGGGAFMAAGGAAGTRSSTGGRATAGGSRNTAGAAGQPAAGASTGGVGGAPTSFKLSCPTGPDDPRLPRLQLGVPTALDGTSFVSGNVQSWHWALVREDCDSVVTDPEFVLQGGEKPVLMFQAVRPSNYRFTLRVTGAAGDSGSCNFEVPTDGRGMRVELCWDTSTTADLDLYLHNPFDQAPWFTPSAQTVSDGINATTCNVANCTANLRLGLPRANFGFSDSPADACVAGPAAAEFQSIGRCPNPREGEDNNQAPTTGTAERIQLDAPLDAQTFRVMVHNFDNHPATPHVFVYCGGKKAGEASPPQSPPNFVTAQAGIFGTMWRAVDITSHNFADGTLDCTVTFPVSPGGQVPYVTINDARF